MRDDDDAQPETSGGSPADGLGDTAEPGDHSSASERYGDLDDAYGDDSYGDGETDDEVVIHDGAEEADGASDSADGTSLDDGDLLAQDASPLEGIGFILDEVRDAPFGPDDDAAADPLATDPAELASDSDRDLTGDGVVDGADLREAASPLDFGIDDPAHGGHDGGVIDNA
jgi:hypothetical protein